MNVKKRVFLFAVVVLTAVLMCGCAVVSGVIDYPVTVMLASSDNLTVSGDNSITVKAGEDAVFEVSIPDGMKFDSISGGAYYEDGRIIVPEVYFPVTVKASVREYRNCHYKVLTTTGGTVAGGVGTLVSDTVIEGDVIEDTVISLSAKPNNKKFIFAGWSIGASVKNGGVIVSTDPTATLPITDDVQIYGNFMGVNAKIIRYNANGGESLKSDAADGVTYVDVVNDDYHFYANTLADMGYFERDGYHLCGYNTEPDGSGEFFGLGWNITLDDTVVDLYCTWVEETPEDHFKFKNGSGKSITITGYTGDDEIIVVPKKINGRKVTEIADGAFKNAGATTVYLPTGLVTVGKKAFTGCAFDTLYMPDTIMDIGDGSFYRCDNFSTLIVGAGCAPTYQCYDHGTYAIKYERLVYAYKHELQKLVFTSGSNGTYGIYSEQLGEGLDGKYYIIDYSLHFETCGRFFIDLISDFLCPDDIMLFLPEPNKYQLGTTMWNSIMWQFFEGAYESVTHVDIRDYLGVFDTFAEFNNSRQWMGKNNYTTYSSIIDVYGDNSWYRPNERDNFYGSQGSYTLTPKEHIDADSMNPVFDKCITKGAKMYFSFPSLNKNALEGKAKNESHRKAYEDYIRDNLHVTVISSIEDYIFKGRYMSGTNYHLSSEGTVIRTDRLIDDLRAQLKIDYPGMLD